MILSQALRDQKIIVPDQILRKQLWIIPSYSLAVRDNSASDHRYLRGPKCHSSVPTSSTSLTDHNLLDNNSRLDHPYLQADRQRTIPTCTKTHLQLVCTGCRRKVGHHSHTVRRRESIHPVPCSGHRPRCSIRDKVLCLRHLIVHLDCKCEWPIVPIRI